MGNSWSIPCFARDIFVTLGMSLGLNGPHSPIYREQKHCFASYKMHEGINTLNIEWSSDTMVIGAIY